MAYDGRRRPEQVVVDVRDYEALGSSGDRPGVQKTQDEYSSDGSSPSRSPPSPASRDLHALPSADAVVSRISINLAKLPPADKQRSGSPAGRYSICRVHPGIRDQDKDAYEPRLVAIGPLHRGKPSLMPMEEVKLGYLRDLLDRSDRNQLAEYVSAVRRCAPEARERYAEKIVLGDEELVETMVLDGCFIIEYFVKRVFGQTSETALLSGVRWGFSHLRRDLMLLENQIPFSVLVILFRCSEIPFSGTRKEPLTLVEITLRFLDIKLPVGEQPSPEKVLHLLHLYHLCLDPKRAPPDPPVSRGQRMLLYPLKRAAELPSMILFGLLYVIFMWKLPRFFSPSKQPSGTAPRMINCASELVEAGVKFKRKPELVVEAGVKLKRKPELVEAGVKFKRKPGHAGGGGGGGVKHFLNASFAADGTLLIPFLKVEESTGSKLRNLIALEQCYPQVGSHFTSYAVLMDNIINTERDVAILRGAGIIESKLGSDGQVADLFNTLCKGTHVSYDTHYNAPLFRDVKDYCDFAHHRWRAALVSTYFNSPWAIVSLLAGCLLLFFAAVQSYFTVYPRK